MEKSNANLVFNNHLIAKLIFKNLDTKSIKNCRLLCKNAAEVGAQIFANYRNPLYFKIYESIWYNKKIINEHNSKKVKWLREQLEKNPDYWVIKAMEIPLFDWCDNQDIVYLMRAHGHLVNDLRLVYQRRFEKDSNEYFEYVDYFQRGATTFLGHILAKLCPNLKRVTVFDPLRNHDDDSANKEDELPTEIPLEYLSLVFEPHTLLSDVAVHGEDGFPLGMRTEFITKILKSCSNLKVLKLAPCSFGSNRLNPLLRKIQGEKLVLKNLEALSLGQKVDAKTLGFITADLFPSLITLQLQIYGGSKIDKQDRMDYPKTLKRLILSLTSLEDEEDKDVLLEVANIIKCFPSVENLEISYIHDDPFTPSLPLNVYASTDSFPNIKSFTTFARVHGKGLDPFLDAIFNLFPNLEKLNILALSDSEKKQKVNFTKLGKFEKLSVLNVEWFKSKSENCIVTEENLREICPTLRRISLDGVRNTCKSGLHILHPLDYSYKK